MNNKIKGFDGLRGLSVLFVIASHAVLWPRIGVTSPAVTSVFSAHVGVSIFFVLSGFLITHLLIKEKQATGSIDLRAFYARRALRIFPLYYLAVIFLLFLDYAGKASIPNCIYPFAFTYTINFIPKSCAFSSMSHFWSLAVEEHFYLIWPFVFLLGKRAAIGSAIVFIAACIYFGTSAFPVLPDFYVNRWTFPAALPIAVGCLLAFACDRHAVKQFFSSESNGAIILVAIVAGMGAPAFVKTEIAWLAAVSLLLLYVYHNQKSVLVRILETRFLATLGVISYGLYVWQGVFTGNGTYRTGHPFPPDVDVGVWLTFIAAPLSYVFFERPILRLKAKFSWRGRAPSTVESPA